jgi:hypothetical protein
VEPRITSNYFKGDPKNLIWFSGIYDIVGYKHDITSAGATSEFTIVRSSGDIKPGFRPAELERDRRKKVKSSIFYNNNPLRIDEK